MSDSTTLLNLGACAADIERPRRLLFRVGALFLFGISVFPSTPAGESATVPHSNAPLRPIPHPDLSRLESAAQQRIRDTRAELNSMAKAGETSREALSQAYGQMGKLYHVQDFLGAAEMSYLNAQSLAPADFRWSYYLGHIYKNKGDLERSIAAYQQALQHQPDNVPAILGAAEGHLSLNRHERARPLFERALELDETCAPALVGMGKIASSRRQDKEEIRYFEAALALQPDVNNIHYLLAMSYRKQGDLDQARIHFQQVAMLERLRRGHATAGYPDPLMEALDDLTTGWRHHWVRGMRAFGKGRFDEAVKEYRTSVALDPKNPIPLTDLGSALARMGDLKGAVREYAQALRASPGNPMLHYYLGTTLMGLQSEEEAAKHYQQAIGANPGFMEAHFQLANLLMRLRRYDDAVPHYAAVMELDSGFGSRTPESSPAGGQIQQMSVLARFMRAMALVQLSRHEEALAILEKGLQVFPGHADMTHAVARLLATSPDDKIRNGMRALQLLKGLFEGQGDLELEYVETLAMAFAETGQFERAAQMQHAMISDLQRNQRFDLARLLTENLSLYQRRQPCRRPWREDDPIFSPVASAMDLPGPSSSTPQ